MDKFETWKQTLWKVLSSALLSLLVDEVEFLISDKSISLDSSIMGILSFEASRLTAGEWFEKEEALKEELSLMFLS